MSNTEPTTSEQLQVALSRVAELTKTVEVLENGKTVSEIFWNQKTGDFMKWKSLSETKKYFEVNHLEFLKTCGARLTSKEFHDKLVEKLEI